MHTIVAGNARSVMIKLAEMDKFLRNAFRALRPRVQVFSDVPDICYVLTPEDTQPQFVIRIQTSIMKGDTESRSTGEDSIRVVVLDLKTKRPITGKAQRVHRVEGWRDNLLDRIEEAVEKFEELEEERANRIRLQGERAEQKQFAETNPDAARRKLCEQWTMLNYLAACEDNGRIPLREDSQGNSSTPFTSMLASLSRTRRLLSEKQVSWAERTYKQLGGPAINLTDADMQRVESLMQRLIYGGLLTPSCNLCNGTSYEPEIALVDYYMPVGVNGFRFVAALEAQLRAWGPVFSTVATQAAYRRAGSTLAHMALVAGSTFEFLRLAVEFTQAQAATFLGVTVPDVQAWESGATPVPTNLWYEMAAEVCRKDSRQFTPYLTLPPVDLRPRIIRVFPDIPRQGTLYVVPPCICSC